MKDKTKLRILAAVVVVTILAMGGLIVKYEMYKVDETMYIHYHH